MWPGRWKSSAVESGEAKMTLVTALSVALIPVVIPIDEIKSRQGIRTGTKRCHKDQHRYQQTSFSP